MSATLVETTTDRWSTRIVPPAAPARRRVASVDLLRGAVMILMVLDHVRDYFSAVRFDPTDLAATTAPLFLTRWVTHFCAPIFILLAGTSAWMAGRRRSRPELARFLVTRGLWLVLLEFTVVNFGWYFNLGYEIGFVGQVIWAIGASMMVLAGLIYLPRPAIAGVAAVMIVGHNLLDGVTAAPGWTTVLWSVLHVEQAHPGLHLFVAYPLIPWIGVMAAGYLLGPLLERPVDQRIRVLLTAGAVLAAGFVVLRALDGYGDPAPWSRQLDATRTLLSFLKVTKYPPSLAYLLVTLGPGLLLWAALERFRGPVADRLATVGRVPLFFYVVHLYLVHLLALGAGWATGYGPAGMARLFLNLPNGYGFGLPVVYLVWAGVIVALYPACRWFDTRKRAGRGWWWSYL